MSDNERDVGYLLRAVEDLTAQLSEHMDKEDGEREQLLKRISAIEEGIAMKKGVMKFIMAMCALAGFLLTLDFNNLKQLWLKLFGA